MEDKVLFLDNRSLLQNYRHLSGSELVNRILSLPRPGDFIRTLSCQDFYWLIKKIGADDSLPLLQLASEEQWQYILDLEIWDRDLFHLERAAGWFQRLILADGERFARWLIEGDDDQYLIHYFLHRSLEIVNSEEKDFPNDLNDFFSLDGVFYFRAKDANLQTTIDTLLRLIAADEFARYYNLLVNVPMVIPAELEEELYRQRNVRLAEQGFLPREEALIIYAPLEEGKLASIYPAVLPISVSDVDTPSPQLPLLFIPQEGVLAYALTQINDPLLLDRLRLEFAGLVNTIISADGLPIEELEDLEGTVKKAADYLNLALENLCTENIGQAKEILTNYALMDLFRMGYTYLLKLHWKAKRSYKESWFKNKGLDFSFWGQQRGNILEGLLRMEPLLYDPANPEGYLYRRFSRRKDLSLCEKNLQEIIVMDKLLGQIERSYSLPEEAKGITFSNLIFTLWARKVLESNVSFTPLSMEELRSFFQKLRNEEKTPPFRYSPWREAFINDFISFLPPFIEKDTTSLLQGALTQLWEEFVEEYAYVPLNELDGRYTSHFFLTKN